MSSTGMDRQAEDQGAIERRDTAAPRVEHEALVEIGARSIGGFEAESVDLSLDGIRVRTAYLPQPGERVACRLDGYGGEIVVEGEVAWCRDEGRGGEFGVRFTSVSPDALARIQEMTDSPPEPHAEEPAQPSDPGAALPGSRVRLHIQGLGSPMRARVRDVARGEVLVGSNLEFLRVGRDVELEDVEHGRTRVAHIEHVGVEIDPETSIPQLVVALSYGADKAPRALKRASELREHAGRDPHIEVREEPEDFTTAPYRVRSMAQPAAQAEAEPPAETTPEPTVIDKTSGEPEAPPATPARRAASRRAAPAHEPVQAQAPERVDHDDDEDIPATQETPADGRGHAAAAAATAMAGRAAAGMGALAKKLGPRLTSAGIGAKGAFGKLLGAVRKRRAERQERARERQPKRTTAPPPTGALRSSGRKLVREAEQRASEPPDELVVETPARSDRKRTVFGATLGALAVVAIYMAASHFSGQIDPAADPAAAPALAVSAADPAAQDVEAGEQPPSAVATAEVPLFGATPLSTTEAVPVPPNLDGSAKPAASAPDAEADKEEPKDEKPAGLTSEWGFGQVVNPTVFRLKMDGKLDGITGAESPSGFTITVPGHKSVSTAAGLERKDKRIKDIRVVNFPDRAEITFKFRDEVPAFVAKARGKVVIIELNDPKAEDKDAKDGAKDKNGAKDDDDGDDKPAAKKASKRSAKRSGSKSKSSSKKKK